MAAKKITKKAKKSTSRRGPFQGFLAALACVGTADAPKGIPDKLAVKYSKLQEDAAKLRDDALRWALKDTTITEAAAKLDVVPRTIARAIEEQPELRDLLPSRSLRTPGGKSKAEPAAKKPRAKKTAEPAAKKPRAKKTAEPAAKKPRAKKTAEPAAAKPSDSSTSAS